MLDAVLLLNSRGVKVHSLIKNKDKYFQDETGNFGIVISTIFAKIQEAYPKEVELTKFTDLEIPKKFLCYYFVQDFDLFIIFTTKKSNSIPKDKVIKDLILKRQVERNFFKGVCVADFDDIQGPVPIFNMSPLDETAEMMLAVQGTTTLGMGMKEMPTTLVGPVPVPTKPELHFLVYGYHRPAPDSEDPRIQLKGRPATIFIIIELSESIDKEVRDFVETFLFQWTHSAPALQPKLIDEDLIRLTSNLQQMIVLAKDLISIRKSQEIKLRELVAQYYSEIVLLREENELLKTQLELKTK